MAVAMSYYQLGKVTFARVKYAESIKSFEKCLKIRAE